MKEPKISWHGPSKRAYLTFRGKRHYLGRWESKEQAIPKAVKLKFETILAELRYLGQRAPKAPKEMTIWELCAAFLDYAEAKLDRSDYSAFSKATKVLCQRFGDLPAAQFTPGRLREIQNDLIGLKLERTQINRLTSMVTRIYKWAASYDMVPASIIAGLRTLPGVRTGQPGVKDNPPVDPVDLKTVKQTLAHLYEPIKSMVKVQLLTGARPGEIRRMRIGEIVQKDRIWVYAPGQHKNTWRGAIREIPLSNEAYKVLKPWLKGQPEDFVFCSDYGPSGSKRVTKPKRGQPYHISAYSVAIKKVCKAHGIPEWCPRQIRKTVAQAVDDLIGIEHSSALAGHSGIDITRQIYAKSQLKKAKEAADKIGKIL